MTLISARQDEDVRQCVGRRGALRAGGWGRSDHYYLAEGTGIARCYTAGSGRGVGSVALTGGTYGAWVAGLDPNTGRSWGLTRVVMEATSDHCSAVDAVAA